MVVLQEERPAAEVGHAVQRGRIGVEVLGLQFHEQALVELHVGRAEVRPPQQPAPLARSGRVVLGDVGGLGRVDVAELADLRHGQEGVELGDDPRRGSPSPLAPTATPLTSSRLWKRKIFFPAKSSGFFCSSSATAGMIHSWFATAKKLTMQAEMRIGRMIRFVPIPGGEHRQQFVVLLHPGRGEDGRHHGDHAAEQVKEHAHPHEIVPAHLREQLADAVRNGGELVEIRERVDDDDQPHQRDEADGVGLDEGPVPLPVQDPKHRRPSVDRLVRPRRASGPAAEHQAAQDPQHEVPAPERQQGLGVPFLAQVHRTDQHRDNTG